jgi:hypothetical protein
LATGEKAWRERPFRGLRFGAIPIRRPGGDRGVSWGFRVCGAGTGRMNRRAGSSGARGSGSVGLPRAPLRPWLLTEPVPGAFPGPTPLLAECRPSCPWHLLHRARTEAGAPRRHRGAESSFLSWDSSAGCAPSSTCQLRVHSTEDESSDRSDGATRRIPCRPRGFSPPRRFAPRSGRGFVAPRYRPWGCMRFGPGASGPRTGRRAALPACGVHTLRRFPLAGSRCRIPATPLPSCRCDAPGARLARPSVSRRPAWRGSRGIGRLQGLAPPTSPLTIERRFQRRPLVPPMGLVPLRGTAVLRRVPDDRRAAPRRHPGPPPRRVARGGPLQSLSPFRPATKARRRGESVRSSSSWTSPRFAASDTGGAVRGSARSGVHRPPWGFSTSKTAHGTLPGRSRGSFP